MTKFVEAPDRRTDRLTIVSQMNDAYKAKAAVAAQRRQEGKDGWDVESRAHTHAAHAGHDLNACEAGNCLAQFETYFAKCCVSQMNDDAYKAKAAVAAQQKKKQQ